MPMYTVEIGATRTEVFVNEVELDIPTDVANDPEKLAAWIAEREDDWHEDLMDGRSEIGPFENVTPILLGLTEQMDQ